MRTRHTSVAFTVVTAILVSTMAVNAADHANPSFDCDMAQTEIERRICGSPELAGLDQTVADRYDALGKDTRSEALRNGIAQDQRQWLRDRDACGEQADASAPKPCLREAYQQRHQQLDFHRSVFVGPPLPHPPSIACEDSATSQVEMRACLREMLNYVERTLEVASAAAAVEMRELDTVTSADIGAEKAFEKSRTAYAAYRDSACAAVAASYAGGSGAGIAMLSCRLQMDWDRANRIASEFLFRPIN